MRLDHLLSKESGKHIALVVIVLGTKSSAASILFNFEGPNGTSESLKREEPFLQKPAKPTWGCSSAGRAPALQAGGQEFEPPHLHQYGLIAQVVRARA